MRVNQTENEQKLKWSIRSNLKQTEITTNKKQDYLLSPLQPELHLRFSEKQKSILNPYHYDIEK